MQKWIVKCSVCGTEFEREAAAMPVGVPAEMHDQPGHPNVPCVGSELPTIAVGEA